MSLSPSETFFRVNIILPTDLNGALTGSLASTVLLLIKPSKFQILQLKTLNFFSGDSYP